MELEHKRSDINYKFKNGVPVVELNLTMYLQVEEVVEKGQNKELLIREDELVTDAVVKKLSENLNKDLQSCVDFMKN